MLGTILVFVHIVIIVTVSVKVIFRRLPVGTSLAWIIIVAIIPYIGLGIYFLLGDHRLGRQRLRLGDLVRRYYQKSLLIEAGAEDDMHPEIDDVFYKIGNVAAQGSGFHIRSNNDLEIITDPWQMFDALIEDINSAAQTCFLEFYIIDPAGRVENVLRAVCDAAGRGVDCKILADHIGSRRFLKSKWKTELEEAGVEIIDSLPTGVIKTFFTRSDLRNHRKIVVIDRNVSFTGSFNLADPEYFNRDKEVGPWVDVFVRIKGDASEALSVVFNTDYVLDTHNRKTIGKVPSLPEIDKVANTVSKSANAPVQVIPSGPEMSTSLIYETIISSIYAAKEYIYITTPYLIPDEPLLLALTNAAKRGVNVRIMVPKNVDSRLVKFASRSYYGELLKSGVEIYEFKAGLLHSKIILIDDSVCYLGTVNFDMRSFYLNLEITIAAHAAEDCSKMKRIYDSYEALSDKIKADDWMDGRRSKVEIFTENVVRLASPLL